MENTLPAPGEGPSPCRSSKFETDVPQFVVLSNFCYLLEGSKVKEKSVTYIRKVSLWGTLRRSPTPSI